MLQCVQLRRGQIYGQDSDPNISYSGLLTSTMCSMERTNPSDRGMPLTLH